MRTILDVLSLLCLCLSRTYSLSLSFSLYFSLSLSLSLSLFISLSLSLLHSFFLSLSLFSHILMDIHTDVERGMAEEHLLQPDSKEGFTTNNYGVRYTLSLEFVTNLLTRLSFLAPPQVEPNAGHQHSLCLSCGS